MDMKKNSVRGLATVLLVVAALLLGSTTSWAGSKLFVNKAADGTLTIRLYDTNGSNLLTIPTQTNNIPKSCFPPDLFWDSNNGVWILTGFDTNQAIDWIGEVDTRGVFLTTGLAPNNCETTVPAMVSCEAPSAPASVTCTYATSAWGPCQSDGVQFRSVVLTSAPGCTGGTVPATSQACTPAVQSTCTSFTYSVWSPSEATCTFGQTLTRTVTSSSPAGCTGGYPITTESCPNGAPTCTSFTYSAWSPSETTCTYGQTLTRTVTSSSPSGCTGGNPVTTTTCTNNPPGGGGATNLPSTGLGMTIGQGVAIAALDKKEYTFTLPTAATSYVGVVLTTRDWQTNQDVYVSTASQPSCTLPSGYNVPPSAQPWYNNTSTNNESVLIFTPFGAGTKFYVTVCNRSNSQGSYGIYWSER